jgi:GNAT superfamily N-acetyltransferase
MGKEILIRKAHPEELKIIQDLNHQLFLFDYERDPDLNVQWPYEKDGEEYFRKMIDGEIGVCFVAEVEGKVVGYLAGCGELETPSYRPVKRAELENMFVIEEYRGAGVGTKLANEFIDWSHSKGVQHIFVSAYAGNERAIKFYQKAGFKPYAFELEIGPVRESNIHGRDSN